MTPPRRQESYASPRRPSVLPTKNREGPILKISEKYPVNYVFYFGEPYSSSKMKYAF